jgi:DNA topoisomerase-1
MARSLVIVESPAKARTIAGFLGNDFILKSSYGHIRDLPTSGLNVDVDNGFTPTYEVSPAKREVIRELRAALKEADELFLATDEDREGEAISWHLLEVLQPRVPVKRMVFHEITRAAIDEAVERWRDLDYGLVDAQETRRILDRLYGYEVSPVLWKKVNRGLSAGRVQSVATRLVVERERERMRFVAAGYWDLEAAFATDPAFGATLVDVDGDRVATGKDFDDGGQVRRGDVRVLDENAATGLAERLTASPFRVASVEERPYTSKPKPPFMTSTLQQEGGRKLRMSAQQVMRVAQGLYERGYITYMRTDSTALSEVAVTAARKQVRELYGDAYVPERPRVYAGKVKNAQEAHEAIRPAGERWRTPEQLQAELRADDRRLYELIWKRTIASQMTDARGQTVSVRIGATSSAGEDTVFAASGRTITFPGYLRAYVEGSDDPEAELDDRESILPAVAVGDVLTLAGLEPRGHSTTPPARFTEASLVKRLEELGVGRPSTYASIMQTIQDRGYVWKRGTALIPTWTAFAVTNLLERHFADLVDYEFTARMEDDLDDIAGGEKHREPWLREFYFGDGRPGLHALVSDHIDEIDPASVNAIPIGVDDEGNEIVVKPGKYGPYVRRAEDTASVPEDLAPDELTIARALELLAAPKGTEPIGHDPGTGLPVYVKSGRYGPYVQLGDADTLPDGQKPKMASLFASMSPETTTMDDALRLLALPRVVGHDPTDGEEVTAQNGRYGPYVKRGKESRSLETEEQLFTVTLEDALRLLAQPKQYGQRRSAAPAGPLRELGADPVSGKPVVVRDGRYGPYVTDGETNASLRRGDSVEAISIERAAELLQLRRESAPTRPRGRKGSGAKKAGTTKKAAGTKKAGSAKKTATRKSAGAVKKAAATRASDEPAAS